MNIIKKSEAIHLDKVEGSHVDYYIFPEFEIHYNQIDPGTTQQWHHHIHVSENLYVLEGTIEAHWVDEYGQKQVNHVAAGDIVLVENSPHTFVNSSDQVVKFIVFRFVPTGKDQREVIKNDKVVDTHLK